MTTLDERDLRDALGCYATGVTVVTTQSARGPLGMTANSFASVSLDPPLVLWSPARRSARFPAFEAASYFAIHVLAEDQRALADRFARSGDDFAGLDIGEGLGGVPLLPGCAAVFECAHAAGHDGGDHLIVVGEVQRMHHNTSRPLLYHRGAYALLEQGEGR
ncbi:flavin reductase family protein [Oceanibium sediminis]|uniref:flavin reductase family protein n=1 Tax=Oceanibium sediminis TaxID=2026339 RepID=UPI000DD35CC4|nr:flavin reductase family protein [Oceanibium sediminis]